MENILFKDILKITLFFVSTLTILSLLFWSGHPEIALALFAGTFVGILRLKAFFRYISSAINNKKENKGKSALIRYLASLVFTLGLLGFILLRSPIIGLAMLVGLIAVPIMVTVYAAFKGISLRRKK